MLNEIDDLRNENAELSEHANALREQHEALSKQASDARGEADEARTAYDVLRRKGENPPCWYEKVPAGEGKTREKAHYIFNIAVYDEAMVVRRHPIPQGRAEDDDGLPYDQEAKQVGLDRIPVDTKLTDDELIRYMRPIHDLGKSVEVRSYSCIFSVKVWDKTSPNAKDRWKRAHDSVLEGLFGTYEVKDDPWPGSP